MQNGSFGSISWNFSLFGEPSWKEGFLSRPSKSSRQGQIGFRFNSPIIGCPTSPKARKTNEKMRLEMTRSFGELDRPIRKIFTIFRESSWQSRSAKGQLYNLKNFLPWTCLSWKLKKGVFFFSYALFFTLYYYISMFFTFIHMASPVALTDSSSALVFASSNPQNARKNRARTVRCTPLTSPRCGWRCQKALTLFAVATRRL